MSLRTFSWAVFILLMIGAALLVNLTYGSLPPMVAVHFDPAGLATSFIPASRYRVGILLFALLLPIVMVSLMTFAYSRATDMKLPHRDYWLAPQRIEHTRAFLITHGIWFGSLLVSLMGLMHWLVLDANRRFPPQLSNQALFFGLFALLVCMLIWIGTLLLAFRRRGIP